jgi:RNA polymerase sigma-70 factor (ECF subfamily)
MRQQLIERAQRGDRDAFALLAAQDIDRLHAVARLILRDPHLAEDAVQEALIRCWRQLPQLREVDKYDGWLYRILVRSATDESSRRRRFAGTIQNLQLEPSISDRTRDVADRDELERGFQKLSLEHRAVIVLHHFADLPLPEVAAALGIRPGTAKSRYHYAMASLRAALEAEVRIAAAEGVRT